MDQLLATKFHIPPLRQELVPRHRLIKRLNTGLHHKLTLISAPAGFGKTTLIGEWLGNTQKDEKRTGHAEYNVTWLSLDKGDNDSTRFLNYFTGALQHIDCNGTTIGKRAHNILQSTQPPQTEAVLTALINDISMIADKTIFVLDDLHLIDSQAIYEALSFFIENMPVQIHLVIATREDPLLPLPRLRARDQLTELRAADLRFSLSESAEFLNHTMGLNLSTEDIAALEKRTEGWIAGLQLAAISMQGQKEPSKLIQSFTGSNRLVLDYLIDEVLQQQSPTIQDFLLNTAILSQLTSSLCDAVRFGMAELSSSPEGTTLKGYVNSQEILEMLERSNLFVIPLDNERRWYRYHHLFADLLRQRLNQTKPEQVSILHSRASAWYEQNGLPDEAVEHAFQAGDFKRSATLIAELADGLWKKGEHLKLRGWLQKLTKEWGCVHPQLCIYQAWFLFSTGHQDESESYLQVAEQALASEATQEHPNASSQTQSTSGPDRTQLEGRLNAVRALVESWGEDYPAMIRHASLALERLPKWDPWHNMAELVLGDAYFYNGDNQAAYQTRRETAEACQADDDLFFYMIANLKVATSLSEMGQLDTTIEICQGQLEFAQQNGLSQTIFAGWAMGLLGVALSEQNNLEKALEFTSKYVELTKGNDLGFVGSSHMFKAKAQFYAGDLEGAETTLKNLADIGQKHYLPHYISGRLKAWQARIYLAQNRLEAVSQLVEESNLETGGAIKLMYDGLVVIRTRLLLVQGNPMEASRVLEDLIESTQDGGSTPRLIELLVLQALAKQAQDEIALAIQNLRRALTLAEPGGYIRVFVDEGPPMARLLYEALSQGIAPKYVQRLLADFPVIEAEPPKPTVSQISEDTWIEPLSEREMEVLKLIVEGLTNQEIASRLYLSLNTVKAHTRNIYGKLGVNNRTQAAAKARALGILSAF